MITRNLKMNNQNIQRMLRYAAQGMAVAVSLNVIPTQKIPTREVLMISFTSAITFMLLDRYVPEISKSVCFATEIAEIKKIEKVPAKAQSEQIYK